MNSNNISFTNSGAGLPWGNNNSQIYDDSNLHISSFANVLIYTPSQLTVGKLSGNPIVSWTSNNCYIQCLSTTGNNWIQFHANSTVTDAQILCTAGTSGTANVGNYNLNFY